MSLRKHNPMTSPLAFKKFEHQDLITFEEIETIEGETRIYKTPNGNFPSMTSILSILDDGGIDEWIKRVGEEEANRIVMEAINRGNSLHDLSEKYLKNELTREEIRGPGRVLFNRVKKYLDKIELVVALEVPLYSTKYKYAGRADGIVMIDGQLTILDHKNSRRPIDLNKSFSRKKIFCYILQLYGYKKALEEMTGLKATQGCLIIGQHQTSNAIQLKYNLDDDFIKEEFEKLILIYYGHMDVKESAYFKL